MMGNADHNAETVKGMTVLEMVIALSILSVVFVAIVPLLTGIRNSWDAQQANAEVIQNGRVVIDHMYRNLIKAVRIEEISSPFQENGYIEFEAKDGGNYRYEIGDNGYIRFGQAGQLSDLAGPVSRLKFTGYEAVNLNVPTPDVDAIRFVRAETTLATPSELSRDRTFATSAYIRTRGSNQGIWKNRDIGDVGAAGSASQSGNNWTLAGSGQDISQRNDAFHYVYRSLLGDGQIIAQVQSIGFTNAWAKSGVMIRETLDDNSKFAFLFGTPFRGYSFRCRTTTAGLAEHTQGSSYWFFSPVWLKLIRSGNTISGYVSSNGLDWSWIESVSIDMDESIYIGLAVTSRNDGVLCVSEVGNVYVTSRPTVGNAAIPRTLTAPQIDGTIDAVWSGAPAHSFNQVVWGIRSWSNPDDDLSGTWKALWDAQCLYYLVDVTDDRLRGGGGSSWRDADTVEVFIDADNSKTSDYDNENDFHYAFRWQDYHVNIGPLSVNDATGVNFAMAGTSRGYRMEIAIPWTTLGVTPSQNYVFGMEMFLNDDDDGLERDTTMSWYWSLDTYWQSPNQWGTAELTEHDFGTDDGPLLP